MKRYETIKKELYGLGKDIWDGPNKILVSLTGLTLALNRGLGVCRQMLLDGYISRSKEYVKSAGEIATYLGTDSALYKELKIDNVPKFINSALAPVLETRYAEGFTLAAFMAFGVLGVYSVINSRRKRHGKLNE